VFHMEQFIDAILEAKRNCQRVYLIGNGGSYANAVHIANDLIACGVRAHTLDPASLTAIANDFGYEHVFSRWLSVCAEAGDVLIALSGSGTSKNILEAMATAQELGMVRHLVTDYLRSMDMQQSEEHQINLGHQLMRALKCAQ